MMGLKNGDKARHGRLRKLKLARRVKNRELRKLYVLPTSEKTAEAQK